MKWVILFILLIPAFSTYAQRHPGKVNIIADRADELCAAREYAAAIRLCDSALPYYPGNYRLLLAKGSSEVRNTDPANGIITLTKAIGLFPDSATLYFLRSTAYNMTDSFTRAIIDIQTAIRLRDKPDFELELASIYGKAGEYEKSIAIAGKLISGKKIPKYMHVAYYLQAYGYEQLGDYEAALTGYTHSLKLKPQNGLALYRRALVYIQLKQPANACADLTAATALPSGGSDWHEMAVALKKETCLDTRY